MKNSNYEFNKIYFLNYLLLIFIGCINSLSDITLLKLGTKNKLIKFKENISIYKLKTNYLNLNISINNFINITRSKISEQFNPETLLMKNCSNSNNTFCFCKLLYI